MMDEIAALPGWVVGGGGGIMACLGMAYIWVKFLLPWFSDRVDKRRATRAEGNREWEAKLAERQAELDEREERFREGLERGLAECQAHCDQIKTELDQLRDDHKVVIFAIRIALPKLAADAPESHEFRLIRQVLAARFPPDPNVPDEWTELLRLLDKKTR